MSKKNKNKEIKKSQKKKAFILSEDFGDVREKTKKDDRFMHLEYTNEGKRRMNNIHQRMSSKVFKDVEAIKDEISKKYDPSDFITNLDEIENLIKEGKYKKATKVSDKDMLDSFIDVYNEMSSESPNWERMSSIARRVITIGKSFFEYCDDPDLEYISDGSYDGLLAKFLKDESHTEPMGIIPKGSKNQKKVDIKYHSLHNNMDKAYILMEEDKAPEGVKETDSVEAFLWRVYKTLGLDSSMEIALEVSPKIDGVSMNATIVDNTLVNPQTRGDKDESIAILGLDNTIISKNSMDVDEFGVQFEVFVTDEDREAASKYLKLNKPYVSNRHAATGIIHRLSTMEDDELINFLNFYPINSEDLDGTYTERMDFIQNFAVVPKDMVERKILKGDLKDLIKQIKKYYNKLQETRNNLSYSIDGMVITVVDDDFQKELGRSGRTNKYQIAYKFDPSTAIGIVKGIHLDTGKKGYRTVQVDLEEPVSIDGVKYPHIPVATAKMFEELELRKGDKVQVHRVGDVIPSFTVLEHRDGKKIPIPKKCPDCGKDLVIEKKRFYCENPLCPGNITGRFTGFFEKLGLDGYGESFADMLRDELGCENLVDVLNIDEKKLEEHNITSKKLLEFPKDLRKAIESKYDYEILGAMGLPGVGPEKARKFLDLVAVDKFWKVKDGLSSSLAIAVVGDGWQESRLYEYITSTIFIYESEAIWKYVKKHAKSGDYTITVGHSGEINDPDTLADICERNKFMYSDSRSFGILICNNPESNSAKVKRAKKIGCPIYTEEEFMKRYGAAVMNPDETLHQFKTHLGFDVLSSNRYAPWRFILQLLECTIRAALKLLQDEEVTE